MVLCSHKTLCSFFLLLVMLPFSVSPYLSMPFAQVLCPLGSPHCLQPTAAQYQVVPQVVSQVSPVYTRSLTSLVSCELAFKPRTEFQGHALYILCVPNLPLPSPIVDDVRIMNIVIAGNLWAQTLGQGQVELLDLDYLIFRTTPWGYNMAVSLNRCVNRFGEVFSDCSNISQLVSSRVCPWTQAIQFKFGSHNHILNYLCTSILWYSPPHTLPLSFPTQNRSGHIEGI